VINTLNSKTMNMITLTKVSRLIKHTTIWCVKIVWARIWFSLTICWYAKIVDMKILIILSWQLWSMILSLKLKQVKLQSLMWKKRSNLLKNFNSFEKMQQCNNSFNMEQMHKMMFKVFKSNFNISRIMFKRMT
jgi:hypothetical protein